LVLETAASETGTKNTVISSTFFHPNPPYSCGVVRRPHRKFSDCLVASTLWLWKYFRNPQVQPKFLLPSGRTTMIIPRMAPLAVGLARYPTNLGVRRFESSQGRLRRISARKPAQASSDHEGIPDRDLDWLPHELHSRFGRPADRSQIDD